MKIDVEIQGDRELIRKLDRLEDAIAAQHLEDAVSAGAEVIREDASRRAPVRTGQLAENIDQEVVVSRKDTAEVDIGPNETAFYGGFVEVGTSKMAAQPHLRPAIDHNKARVQREVQQKLRVSLLKEVR